MTPVDLFAAKQAAERIVEAFEAWDLRGRKFERWEGYIEVARDEGLYVARAFLAMPEVQAAHWGPVLAGGRT